jgi:hypothetical protein
MQCASKSLAFAQITLPARPANRPQQPLQGELAAISPPRDLQKSLRQPRGLQAVSAEISR